VGGWLLWAGLALAAAATASAADPTLAALTEDGVLIVFSAARPGEVRTVRVVGVSGRLAGIDRRPANGRLYGVTTAGDVYTIDPSSGAAAPVSTLTLPFNGGSRSGVDFNPKTDRLRLVGADGQNLRANVDNGATAADRSLAWAREDPHFGEAPAIAGTAYTNSVPGADTTDMFDLDAAHDCLLRQDPPNDGTLTTVGPLGVHLPPEAGFEIVTDASGRNRGFAAFSSTLYEIDLATGAATSLGTIGGASGSIVGLTLVGTSAGGAP
jgi:hypothetical protein